MNTTFIKDALSQIPPEVRYFLKRALIIFISWQLLYNLVLFPAAFPDKQLTNATAKSTSFLYQQLINKNTQITFKEKPDGITIVYVNGRQTIGIADHCNALGLYVLYVALLFCFKAPLKRKIIFSIAGCGLIFILNGFRCFMLTWLYLKQFHFFDFIHHYVFSTIIYILIFFMWVLFIRRLKYDMQKNKS